jgi:hypothetical protein
MTVISLTTQPIVTTDSWGDVGAALTDILCGFIQQHRQPGRPPITRVYDLLSEELYQKLFSWDTVAHAGVSVYHRVFPDLAGPDCLTSIADVLAQALPRFYSYGVRFGLNRWYRVPEENAVASIGFEFPLGSNRQAAREDDPDRMVGLRDECRRIAGVSGDTLEKLALAEVLWRKVQAEQQLISA